MSATGETEVYRYVEGVYLSRMFNEKAIKSMFERKPQPGDIFVAGYPKSGTKWLQYIIYCILNDGRPPTKISEFIQGSTLLRGNHANPSQIEHKPGALKTHLPFHKAPYGPEAKYVYVCRNPYDTCVSYFHHTTCRPVYQFQDGTFDEFLDMFLNGKVDFGDYFDNVLSWYAQRERPNILLVTYENLKEDTRTWLLKIAGFLGEEHATKLQDNPDLMSRILKMCSAEETTKNLNAVFKETCQQGWYRQAMLGSEEVSSGETPADLKKPLEIPFIRKGVVGDWKEYFTPDKVRKMKEKIALKTAFSDVMSIWNGLDIP
ncbi:hypothetical protein HPB47_013963 [Ixodes persulcatus]|uniref:Uncharacterized protein n=1 Tax=Ixodes persulcatus TaxID=34615 RepID=A0AC60QY28_IXOPE|nr:hypothetical protein HPB47_013963 [Ixodes persulcatus]